MLYRIILAVLLHFPIFILILMPYLYIPSLYFLFTPPALRVYTCVLIESSCTIIYQLTILVNYRVTNYKLRTPFSYLTFWVTSSGLQQFQICSEEVDWSVHETWKQNSTYLLSRVRREIRKTRNLASNKHR